MQVTARLQGARHCQRSPVVTDYRAVMDLVLKGWSVRQIRTTVGCSHTTVQKAREALEASGITTEAQLAGLSSESLAGLWQRQARRTGEQSSCIGSCQPGSKRCSRGAREPSPLKPRCRKTVPTTGLVLKQATTPTALLVPRIPKRTSDPEPVGESFAAAPGQSQERHSNQACQN